MKISKKIRLASKSTQDDMHSRAQFTQNIARFFRIHRHSDNIRMRHPILEFFHI